MSGLGDRMKDYEATTNSFSLDQTKPYIVRLDGHHFSRFLSAFNKPNDERIHKAMLQATHELVLRFRPSIGFTCSDEITLVFPVDEEQKVMMPFSGRILKICTLLSGIASVVFYKTLISQIQDQPNLLCHVTRTIPHFDARAFNVSENYELVNNIKWRHLFDYRRNSISGLAHRHFNYKAIHGLHSDQLLQKLLEKNIDWEKMDNWYKWGAFVKLEKYNAKVWIGKKQGKEVPQLKEVSKFRTISIVTELQKKYSKEDESFVLSPFVDSTDQHLGEGEEVVDLGEEIIDEEGIDEFEGGHATSPRLLPQIQPSKAQYPFSQPITIEWNCSSEQNANEVKLAIDVNEWKPIPMTKNCGSGTIFSVTLPLVPGSIHLYKFIVDGMWKHDPTKPHVFDGIDGMNNILYVQ